MQDSLYVIQSEIGNQCNALRSALVCSCWEDLIWQMHFGFFYSLCRRHSGTPARRQLT